MPKHRERKEEFSIITKLEAFYTGGNVQFSKDGQFFLCTCGEQVKVVSVSDGKIIYSVGTKKSGEELSSFLLANNDETLVTAAKNGILKQWNLKDQMLMRTWKSLHIGRVSCMAFDQTVTLLATGGSDSTIKVWDIRQKYCTHNLKGAQGVFSTVQFQEIDSNLYVFGSADDCKIRLWDLKSSQQVAALEGHCSTVTGIVFVDKLDKMISCSRDKVVIIWGLSSCLTNGKALKIIPVFEALESLFLAPDALLSSFLTDESENNDDDLYFVTAGEKGILRVWNAAQGKCVFSQTNSLIAPPEDSKYEGQVITHASYVPSLDVVSVVTYEHNIILYKIHDFELFKQFVGYNDDVLDVKFMGKDDSFLAVATNSPHIKIFELATCSCQLLKGHLDIVVSLDVFSHDPYMLISSSKDNSVRVWQMDSDSKEVSCIFMGFSHTHSVGAVACSRGKLKYFVSGSEDTTLKLWDIPAKVPLVALKLTLTPRCTVKAHEKNINSVNISLNDKLIATGSQDSTAKIWSAEDLSLVGTMRGHKKGVWCVMFSPVDMVLATSSGDGTIKIWSLSDFSVLKTFEGHNASVFKVHFLSSGTQLISSASDGLLKLWDIKHNECMKTYDGHDDKVWALTVSSNEQFVVSGAADSNIILWQDVTKEEEEKYLAKKEELLQGEQDLQNFIQQKKWLKALGLAIMLDQPFRVLTIMKEILKDSQGPAVLEETITKMRQDEIDKLLKFATDWNTNSKHYFPAQIVLKAVLKKYSPDELLKMPDIRATVEALLPYTERHYNRLNNKLQGAEILTFLLQNMKIGSLD